VLVESAGKITKIELNQGFMLIEKKKDVHTGYFRRFDKIYGGYKAIKILERADFACEDIDQ